MAGSHLRPGVTSERTDSFAALNEDDDLAALHSRPEFRRLPGEANK
jgi:hypothetical protein